MEQNITMQKLKQQRLNPAEKFVLETIKGVRPGEPDKYGNIRWFKDGIGLFIQDFKINVLWVNYDYIWSVLEKKYGLNDNEIQQLINNVMYKYTNNGKLMPVGSSSAF
jgi:hypothetical protein